MDENVILKQIERHSHKTLVRGELLAGRRLIKDFSDDSAPLNFRKLLPDKDINILQHGLTSVKLKMKFLYGGTAKSGQTGWLLGIALTFGDFAERLREANISHCRVVLLTSFALSLHTE